MAKVYQELPDQVGGLRKHPLRSRAAGRTGPGIRQRKAKADYQGPSPHAARARAGRLTQVGIRIGPGAEVSRRSMRRSSLRCSASACPG
jgi:hypothetical protein